MIFLLSFKVIAIVVLHYVHPNCKQAEKSKNIQTETYMKMSIRSFRVLITLPRNGGKEEHLFINITNGKCVELAAHFC